MSDRKEHFFSSKHDYYIVTEGVALNKGKERPRTMMSLSRIILPRSPSRSFFVMLISSSNVSAIPKRKAVGDDSDPQVKIFRDWNRKIKSK